MREKEIKKVLEIIKADVINDITQLYGKDVAVYMGKTSAAISLLIDIVYKIVNKDIAP